MSVSTSITKNHSFVTLIALTLAIAFGLGMATTAYAQPNGLYFAPKIGYSHMKTDRDAHTYEDGELAWIPPANGKYSKGAIALALAVGYDFKPAHDFPLRAEFEYAWRPKKEMFNKIFEDTEIFKIGAQSFFVNAYFDIHNSSPVTPYVGAGLGLAIVSFSDRCISTHWNGVVYDDTLSKNKTNFAWNIGAGAAWKITDSVALDLGYRYVDFGKAETEITLYDDDNTHNWDVARDVVKAKLSTHEVLLGLRYTF